MVIFHSYVTIKKAGNSKYVKVSALGDSEFQSFTNVSLEDLESLAGLAGLKLQWHL